MEPARREWLSSQEAIKVAGFNNHVTFLKVIRARKIQCRIGPRNKKMYSRARMEELARDRLAAEQRRARFNGRNGDPLNDPRMTGEIEAEVFKLFDNKTEPADVVIQLKLPSAYVDDLFERWWRMRQRGQAWLHPVPLPPVAPPPAAPPFVPALPVSFVPPVVVSPAPPRMASETAEALSSARAAAEAASKAAAEMHQVHEEKTGT